MSKPKLLIIGALPPPYIGPSVAIQQLLKAQTIFNNFEIIHLDISDKRNATNIGQFDFQNLFLGIVHILKLLKIFSFLKPDLVYIGISQGLWGYLRDLGFIIPAILFRKKIIVHLRGSEFHHFYHTMPFLVKKITEKVFHKICFGIVLGQRVKNVFAELLPPSKIRVVPNGIDYTSFKLNGNLQKREGILYLANLMERKGFFKFLESLPIVLNKYPHTKITIAGDWLSVEEKKRTFQMLEKLRLNNNVDFKGPVKDKEKLNLYLSHQIFVFPPIKPEGMPWVILEAMSAAMPVISTNQGTIPEVILDNKTGYIINPEPENIAETICHLIENPEKSQQMGISGRNRVEKLFSEQIYFERLNNIFKKALLNETI